MDVDALEATRETAVGEVEEANAAIGAALCGATLPEQFVPLLQDVQNDLIDLADDLSTRRSPVIDDAAVRQVLLALDRHRSGPVPAEFAVLGGSTRGVGLLRLARMTVRRAARTVRRLALAGRPAAYLDALAELLLVLAYESELVEARQFAVACCDGPVTAGAAHVVSRRAGRTWLSTGDPSAGDRDPQRSAGGRH
jgi:cob(I)alamin adenosyltransferase